MDYLSCNAWQSPTFLANFCSRTALSDIIIWVHINIKYHLLFHRNKWFFVCLKMSWRSHIENCSYIYFMRDSLNESLFEIISIFETEVSAIHISCQSEWKFSVMEILRFNIIILDACQHSRPSFLQFVIWQPSEKQIAWKHAFIKYLQPIWIKV